MDKQIVKMNIGLMVEICKSTVNQFYEANII